MNCFFVKQKTAYEMRISDWSSDVCSSDLPDEQTPGLQPFVIIAGAVARIAGDDEHAQRRLGARHRRFKRSGGDQHVIGVAFGLACLFAGVVRAEQQKHDRSEEHTSELQSLMRISYAVFCLKKKHVQSYTRYARMVTVH